MINVGITGTYSAVARHVCALNKIPDIRITARWVFQPQRDIYIDYESEVECSDPEVIIGKADVMIIADAGSLNIASLALKKARHVFLYPSLIHSSNEINQLSKLAREANVILKCGRTGKLDIYGLLNDLPPEKSSIDLMELRHTSSFERPQGMGNIYDILLGDIEIITNLIQARNTLVKAKGLCMVSAQPDIINARLEFDNGSAVNYYCNLVDTRNEHNITLILKDRLLKYSLITQELSGWHLKRSVNRNENPIFINNIQVTRSDYLYNDLSGFFNMIRAGIDFISIYDNGFESFVLTERILEKVSKTLIQYA